MKIDNKMLECPMNNKIELNGKKCKKCEHYITKKWFTYNGSVDAFCGFDMTDNQRAALKDPHKAIKNIIAAQNAIPIKPINPDKPISPINPDKPDKKIK